MVKDEVKQAINEIENNCNCYIVAGERTNGAVFRTAKGDTADILALMTVLIMALSEESGQSVDELVEMFVDVTLTKSREFNERERKYWA